jgi:hypothetical protein
VFGDIAAKSGPLNDALISFVRVFENITMLLNIAYK